MESRKEFDTRGKLLSSDVLSNDIDCPVCIAKAGEDCWIEIPVDERETKKKIAEQNGDVHVGRIRPVEKSVKLMESRFDNVKAIIIYYSIGDKKGNRADLAIGDCVKAIETFHNQELKANDKKVVELWNEHCKEYAPADKYWADRFAKKLENLLQEKE